MSQRRVNETSLTATADALRAKLGTSDPITWVENEGFKEAVESIQTDSGGADVSGVTATETEVLENAIFVDAHGEYKEGTIPRNGDTSATFDGIETKSVEIPAGYTTGGKVELDGTIDNAVEAARTSLANKGVDVPTDTDVRGLAGLIDSISEAGGGGELQELDVTPSHEAQEFIPAEGVAGYKKVTVKPVPRVKAAVMSVEDNTIPPARIVEDMREWRRNPPAQSAYTSIVYNADEKENVCQYTGVGMHELIGFPVILEAGKKYTLTVEYYSPHTLIGDYSQPYAANLAFMPISSMYNGTDTFGSSYAYTLLPLSVPEYATFILEYAPASTVVACAVLATGATRDAIPVELHLKNIRLTAE